MPRVARLGGAGALLAGAVLFLQLSGAISGDDDGSGYEELDVTVENLSFAQPLSPAALATHDGSYRAFELGEPAGPQLVQLAENGNAQPIVSQMSNSGGVEFVAVLPAVPPMDSRMTRIKLYDDAPYITLLAMAVNTNDCFVALNAEKVELEGHKNPIKDHQVFYLPGLDAGSEENNELCSSVPGPACASWTGNVRSLNGEGKVHVHRGFHGVNEGDFLVPKDLGTDGVPLQARRYDWRNPMVKVTLTEV